MARKILGLDLGTNSIGWAVVNEAENENEMSSIVKLGVRVNPLTVDEQQNFEKGKPITTNADRTLKRGMRRNLQRYKLRREHLVETLKSYGFISDDTVLAETGNRSTFETYRLRAKAATECITLEEFARVLLMINKKRGYKSSRKAKNEEEGQLIDGMEVAKRLYDENLTPGQLMLQLLEAGKKNMPDFYRSDLQAEFDHIWEFQKQFYPDILTDALKQELNNKNEKQTWAICATPFNIVGIKRETKGEELKKENCRWRVNSLSQQMDLEQLAVVLQKVNGQMKNSSGYLGTISDRSKELYFNKQTVGQFQMEQLDKNPNYSLRNQVFYRQDYLDEFEKLWETQAQFHPELTPERKKAVRDIAIFYQRPLKSCKGLINYCELESRQIDIIVEGKKKTKTVGCRVCPKSSPLFQEFKIWQILNNVMLTGKIKQTVTRDLFGTTTAADYGKRPLTQEEKETLFAELNIKDKLSKTEALKLLFTNWKDLDLNFKDLEGNRTNSALFKAYQTIIAMSGHGEHDFAKMKEKDVMEIVKAVFQTLGIRTDILQFDPTLEGDAFEKQPFYRFWHLLYSYEGDKSKIGNESLIRKLEKDYGFGEYAPIVANVVFQPDYGSLSTKAMRKILPYMKEGTEYSVACEYAGYRHSKRSLTREELDNKELKDRLDILPRNSLRNPVVEKILNQMINVVNQVVETYGKPDEIRIELARELKKSAKEREELSKAINKNTAEHEEYRKILQSEFGIQNVSRTDITRYKLYKELEKNGYKTLYSGTYIPREKLFSKEFDIEHIIPQAKLFDDSFSNKTLEARSVNLEKSNSTAYDYVLSKDRSGAEDYKARVESLFKDGVISKTKYKKLLMREEDIPSGFIERDLRDTQYIAKKAREILESLVREVVATTGSITDRLRDDWQLVDVMKELNFEKYNRLGLTEVIEDKDGRRLYRIKDWTKRNDHRHHAMDALTIAFTKRSYIQYLNYLNARVQKGAEEKNIDLDYVELGNLDKMSKADRTAAVYGIERKEMERDNHGKLRFKAPMPLRDFRAEAKRQLENVLVSIKAKNKVVTRNVNTTKRRGGTNKKVQLTPRGQLHNETVYGRIRQYATKEEKVGSNFDYAKIETVATKRYREALLNRLFEFDGDAKKAFTGKNSLANNPIYVDAMQTEKVPERVKTVTFEPVYTIRKEISKDLKVEKVVDANIRRILTQRLKEHGNDAAKAFSNLDENPIWLNKAKGIRIKRVTIDSGLNSPEPLHAKRDHLGNLILDADGNKHPTDYVNTSNNHHVAIYRDADGNLQDNTVSFYEATARATVGLPVIDREYNRDKGWQFLFTMKQNEYFVFPNKETGFDPNEIDLRNPDNYALISPNMYRLQKMSRVAHGNSVSREYVFRHHLETTINSDIKDLTFKKICSLPPLDGVVKVRVNHVGQIVDVGEY